MEVYGKERGFLMTVGASAEIAKLCPEKKLENLRAVFGTEVDDVSSLENTAAVVAALSRGYEQNKHFLDPAYKADPLTVEMLLSLDMTTFRAITSEAVKAMTPRREIESEPIKKNMDEAVR